MKRIARVGRQPVVIKSRVKGSDTPSKELVNIEFFGNRYELTVYFHNSCIQLSMAWTNGAILDLIDQLAQKLIRDMFLSVAGNMRRQDEWNIAILFEEQRGRRDVITIDVAVSLELSTAKVAEWQALHFPKILLFD